MTKMSSIKTLENLTPIFSLEPKIKEAIISETLKLKVSVRDRHHVFQRCYLHVIMNDIFNDGFGFLSHSRIWPGVFKQGVCTTRKWIS